MPRGHHYDQAVSHPAISFLLGLQFQTKPSSFHQTVARIHWTHRNCASLSNLLREFSQRSHWRNLSDTSEKPMGTKLLRIFNWQFPYVNAVPHSRSALSGSPVLQKGWTATYHDNECHVGAFCNHIPSAVPLYLDNATRDSLLCYE